MSDFTRLGSEMEIYNWQIFAGTLVILALMLTATLSARTPGREDIIIFVLVLGVTWPFLMGRYDFLIHRIGAWMAAEGSHWEVSDIRNYKKWMLFFYDAGSAFPILFLFGHAVYRTWNLGYRAAAASSVVAFLIGLGMFIYAPLVHNELQKTQ